MKPQLTEQITELLEDVMLAWLDAEAAIDSVLRVAAIKRARGLAVEALARTPTHETNACENIGSLIDMADEALAKIGGAPCNGGK